MGYRFPEIAVGTQTNLTVDLSPDNQLLDEVIVIGYGQQNRRDLTGSIASVNEQVMKSVPRTNAATLLRGTAPGVRVQQSTGQPGATPRVILGGGTNFDGTGPPLFVVDGVIVPSRYGINPSDIESMDVLKDAASLAIYGARAGNGVVLVTTKKGKQGRTQVTYTNRNATNYVRRNGLQYLSAEGYIRYNRIGLRNRFLLAQADNNTSEMNNTRNQLNGSWGFAANSSFTRSNGLYSTQHVTNANRQLIGNPMWNLLVDQNPFNTSQTDSLLYRATSQRELEDLILQPENPVPVGTAYPYVGGANRVGLSPTLITKLTGTTPPDTRIAASFRTLHNNSAPYALRGVLLTKFLGRADPISSSQIYDTDFPIFRYADVVLLLAEAKTKLGESPKAEIDAIRKRAYGPAFKPFTPGSTKENLNAILDEYQREFIGEGRYWWAERRAGDAYVYDSIDPKYLSPAQSYKLLLPISVSMLNSDPKL